VHLSLHHWLLKLLAIVLALLGVHGTLYVCTPGHAPTSPQACERIVLPSP